MFCRLRSKQGQRGVAAVEYGILASLIAVAIVTSVGLVSGSLSAVIGEVAKVSVSAPAPDPGDLPANLSCEGGVYVGSHDNWWYTDVFYYTHGVSSTVDGIVSWSGYVNPGTGQPYAYSDPGSLLRLEMYATPEQRAGSRQYVTPPTKTPVTFFNPCAGS